MTRARRCGPAALAVAALILASSACSSGPSTPSTQDGAQSDDEAVEAYVAETIAACAERGEPLAARKDDPCIDLAQWDAEMLSGALFGFYVENIAYPSSQQMADPTFIADDLGVTLTDGNEIVDYDADADHYTLCVAHPVSGAWALVDANGGPTSTGGDGTLCEETSP